MGKKILIALVLINLIVADISIVYLFFYRRTSPTEVDSGRIYENNNAAVNDGAIELSNNETFTCNEVCQKTIEDKVAELIPSKSFAAPTLSNPKTIKTKIVSYIPIPGAGNTTNTSWTNLAGTEFSFSKGDYAGFKEAYLEANMKLFNGNGTAYVRLYDVTNNRAVDGSEIQTSSQASVSMSSGKISLWEGNNTYRVQARSLTADTTYFESGRLKIINEQ